MNEFLTKIKESKSKILGSLVLLTAIVAAIETFFNYLDKGKENGNFKE